MKLLLSTPSTQPYAALALNLTWCLTPSSTDSMLHCIRTT